LKNRGLINVWQELFFEVGQGRLRFYDRHGAGRVQKGELILEGTLDTELICCHAEDRPGAVGVTIHTPSGESGGGCGSELDLLDCPPNCLLVKTATVTNEVADGAKEEAVATLGGPARMLVLQLDSAADRDEWRIAIRHCVRPVGSAGVGSTAEAGTASAALRKQTGGSLEGSLAASAAAGETERRAAAELAKCRQHAPPSSAAALSAVPHSTDDAGACGEDEISKHAAAFKAIAHTLPFGGDTQKAMRAGDRNAIRAIMRTKQAIERGESIDPTATMATGTPLTSGNAEADKELASFRAQRGQASELEGGAGTGLISTASSASSAAGSCGKCDSSAHNCSNCPHYMGPCDNANCEVCKDEIAWEASVAARRPSARATATQEREDTAVATAASTDRQDLPYGGDVQAAQRAGDRAAIRAIMGARQAAERGQ
jgi:hypothetical protein